MSTSLMYHTQQIRGFQHSSLKFKDNKVIQCIKRKNFYCNFCSSSKVRLEALRVRQIQALPYGLKKTYFEFTIHRIYCLKCKRRQSEKIPFLSHPKSRITQALERTVVELRSEMSRLFAVFTAELKMILKQKRI